MRSVPSRELSAQLNAPPLRGGRFIVLCRGRVPGVRLREEAGDQGKESRALLLPVLSAVANPKTYIQNRTTVR